jgi:RNA methyltransferase, TrmH family
VSAVVDAERRVPALERALAEVGCEAMPVSPELLAWASSLGHHARISAVVERAALPRLVDGSRAAQVGLRLHGLSDPGNVGTLVRAADVLGPAHVAIGEGTADPLAPKAVRASMGALFRVPIVRLADAPPARRIALDAGAAEALWDVELELPLAFELGAERAGLPDRIVRSADAAAAIPLAPGGESLNVAMAGAIALYELRRRS